MATFAVLGRHVFSQVSLCYVSLQESSFARRSMNLLYFCACHFLDWNCQFIGEPLSPASVLYPEQEEEVAAVFRFHVPKTFEKIYLRQHVRRTMRSVVSLIEECVITEPKGNTYI